MYFSDLPLICSLSSASTVHLPRLTTPGNLLSFFTNLAPSSRSLPLIPTSSVSTLTIHLTLSLLASSTSYHGSTYSPSCQLPKSHREPHSITGFIDRPA